MLNVKQLPTGETFSQALQGKVENLVVVFLTLDPTNKLIPVYLCLVHRQLFVETIVLVGLAEGLN